MLRFTRSDSAQATDLLPDVRRAPEWLDPLFEALADQVRLANTRHADDPDPALEPERWDGLS